MMAGRHGGMLRRGSLPGNTPGTGRPRDEWKAKLQQFASCDETMNHVIGVLNKGADDPNFFKALEYATEHGFGRAQQTLEVDVGRNVAAWMRAAEERLAKR